MTKAPVLVASAVKKSFQVGGNQLDIIKGISVEVFENDTVAIVGPSGSGKTTLLAVCAGLDKPTEGKIELLNESVASLSEDELATFRNEHIGFIFQNFQLLPNLTAIENVLIPMELKGMSNKKEKAEGLLTQVGLGNRMDHYPTQLSGGEQQRVAIARAFANDPKILFADEPTGNLDQETSIIIEELLFNLNKTLGTTLIIITHDSELAKKADRIFNIKSGLLEELTQEAV